jgi:uncharacterized membrane protein YkoI
MKTPIPLLALTTLVASTIFLLAVAPPQNRIPFTSAQKNALAACSGKVESSSLEQVKSEWVYSFNIRTKAKKNCVVTVDAMTGLIISKDTVSESN